MTDTCNCATNPNAHVHRMLRPQQVAPLIGRPFHTVDTWRKRGQLASTGVGYGQTRVCLCCAAELAVGAEVRWEDKVRKALKLPGASNAA